MSSLPDSPRPNGRRRPFLALAEKTPAGRDRYVDFLRAFSICVVVLGHWLIASVYLRDGEVGGVNALHVIPGIWVATWILQVMPLFFFVGGFANLVTLDSLSRKGGDYAGFISSRVDRLLRPTAVFLAVWIP
ncbi:MAG: acyltransferase family protein, partial [Actinomycetota bacterium]